MNLYDTRYGRERECDECYALGVPLVELRKEQDDHGSWLTARFCEKCLRSALALITNKELDQ